MRSIKLKEVVNFLLPGVCSESFGGFQVQGFDISSLRGTERWLAPERILISSIPEILPENWMVTGIGRVYILFRTLQNFWIKANFEIYGEGFVRWGAWLPFFFFSREGNDGRASWLQKVVNPCYRLLHFN